MSIKESVRNLTKSVTNHTFIDAISDRQYEQLINKVNNGTIKTSDDVNSEIVKMIRDIADLKELKELRRDELLENVREVHRTTPKVSSGQLGDKIITRAIPNYEGYYTMNTDGVVMSIDRNVPKRSRNGKYEGQTMFIKGKTIKPMVYAGVNSVVLSKNGKTKMFSCLELLNLTFPEMNPSLPFGDENPVSTDKNYVKGVRWDEMCGKWTVNVALKGTAVYLGVYADKNEANDVANRAFALRDNGFGGTRDEFKDELGVNISGSKSKHLGVSLSDGMYVATYRFKYMGDRLRIGFGEYEDEMVAANIIQLAKRFHYLYKGDNIKFKNLILKLHEITTSGYKVIIEKKTDGK